MAVLGLLTRQTDRWTDDSQFTDKALRSFAPFVSCTSWICCNFFFFFCWCCYECSSVWAAHLKTLNFWQYRALKMAIFFLFCVLWRNILLEVIRNLSENFLHCDRLLYQVGWPLHSKKNLRIEEKDFQEKVLYHKCCCETFLQGIYCMMEKFQTGKYTGRCWWACMKALG